MTIDDTYSGRPDTRPPEQSIPHIIQKNRTKCDELTKYFKEKNKKKNKKLALQDVKAAKPLSVIIMRSCYGDGVEDLVEYFYGLYPDSVKEFVNGQLPIHVMPNADASACKQNLEARVFLMKKYPEGLKIKYEKEKSHHTLFSSAIREEETDIVEMIVQKFPHILLFKLENKKNFFAGGNRNDNDDKEILPFNYAIKYQKFESATILFIFYPDAIMMGSSPSLGHHNDESLIPRIIKYIERKWNSNDEIQSWQRKSFICLMDYFSNIKNIAQNEMEEKIQNTTEAENQLLSTIKNKWPNDVLKSILKTMIDNKKQKMVAGGGGQRGVRKIDNLISLSSNNIGENNGDDDNGRLVYKIKLLYSAAASASTQHQHQQSRGGNSNSVLNDTIQLLDAKNENERKMKEKTLNEKKQIKEELSTTTQLKDELKDELISAKKIIRELEEQLLLQQQQQQEQSQQSATTDKDEQPRDDETGLDVTTTTHEGDDTNTSSNTTTARSRSNNTPFIVKSESNAVRPDTIKSEDNSNTNTAVETVAEAVPSVVARPVKREREELEGVRVPKRTKSS